jgi:predicted nucleic acid-binding protein
MAADATFIDTNVLVFATIPASPLHTRAIAALHALAQSGSEGWISRQVVREYLVQLTRPGVLPTALSGPLAAGQAAALLSLYRVADESGPVFRELIALLHRGLAAGKQVHDANIVATCLAYGIPSLLTHNAADFQRFSGLIRVETI